MAVYRCAALLFETINACAETQTNRPAHRLQVVVGNLITLFEEIPYFEFINFDRVGFNVNENVSVGAAGFRYKMHKLPCCTADTFIW